MYCFDVETMDVESTSVILSLAIVHFIPEKTYSYQDLLDRTLFIKFDAKEQLDLGRTFNQDTIEWWEDPKRQYVRSISYDPSANDVSVAVGLEKLKKYVDVTNKKRPENNQTVWARGILDQSVIESLCRLVDFPMFTCYNNWRDVRTAIDIMYGTSNGYCKVGGDFVQERVLKHHPAHDVCYDVMMLLYGEPNG